MKYLELFLMFLKLGCTSFGGPVAHLVYFRECFVVHRKWLSEQEYTQIIALCQTLPGPASSQVGFCIGLLRGGLIGACIAFVAFTLPSVLLLIAFANYLFLFSSEIGVAALHGLVILAFAVVLHGVISMGKTMCASKVSFSLAVFTFAVVVLMNVALVQVLAILVCACAGLVLIKPETSQKPQGLSNITHLSKLSSSIALAVFVGLFVTLPLVWPLANEFYRSGALVFGGGHVVLPLLEASFVAPNYVSQNDFLAGYGATQALPGPMFSFAAYLGYLVPEHGGIGGALIGVLFIFLPGFLLLIAVLPYWQTISGKALYQGAIAGANAAVVGLLAAALYDPIFTHAIVDATDLIIAAIAYTAISRFNTPILWVVLFCVLAKVLLTIL